MQLLLLPQACLRLPLLASPSVDKESLTPSNRCGLRSLALDGRRRRRRSCLGHRQQKLPLLRRPPLTPTRLPRRAAKAQAAKITMRRVSLKPAQECKGLFKHLPKRFSTAGRAGEDGQSRVQRSYR